MKIAGVDVQSRRAEMVTSSSPLLFQLQMTVLRPPVLGSLYSRVQTTKYASPNLAYLVLRNGYDPQLNERSKNTSGHLDCTWLDADFELEQYLGCD